MQGQSCLCAVFRKANCHYRLVAGSALFVLPSKGEDEALWIDHLAAHAALPMLGPLGGAHADPVGAARSQVHLAMGHDEALRPPPAHCPVGFGPRSKYELTRRIENA